MASVVLKMDEAEEGEYYCKVVAKRAGEEDKVTESAIVKYIPTAIPEIRSGDTHWSLSDSASGFFTTSTSKTEGLPPAYFN